MGDTSGVPRSGLRLEAKPFTWLSLTEDQRKVVADIHEWLIAYLDITPESENDIHASPLGRSIDQARASNVLLIDGGRGSGKTSVLLSLLHLWNQSLGKIPDEEISAWEPIREHLEQLKGMVIPVQVLDLQPLPPSTSLRTWIAGRLLTLAETSASQDAAPKRGRISGLPTWTPSDEEEPAWRSAWRDLLQDAAAGWHQGGGPDRRRLDPESLAVELEQAEFARLSIVEHWRKFVDEVVRSVCSSNAAVKKDARIIIPIDDADMNPTRCVELLELLRTLWHPRVVFLLTGHSDLFLKTLTLHFLGVFRAQLGGREGSELERSVIEDREPTADDLAFQTYDKVLPPRQRFTLDTLTSEERLRLLVDVLDIRLQKPDAHPRPTSLREYFELHPYVRPALPDRLRKIQNLRQGRDQLHAHERRAAPIAYALWRDAFADERYRLPTEIARRIEQMVGLEDGRIQIRGMEWRFQRRVSRTKHFQFQGESYLLRLTEAAGFAFPLRIGERSLDLPSRLTAALLLAVDLFLEERDERFDLLSPMLGGFDHDLVKNELTFLVGPGNNMGAPFNQPPAATWPLPDWRTSLDFAIFDEHWNQALRSSSGAQEKRIGFIARAFLWAALAAYKREPMMNLPSMESEQEWDVISRELVEVTRSLAHQSKRTERDEIFLNWLLGRAILLAAPESGLPPDCANRLLAAWLDHLQHEGVPLRERALQAARAERQWQAARMNRRSGNLSDFLVDLDSRFPDHHWARKIEMHAEADRSSLQDLVGKELADFSVYHKNRELSEPRDLRSYMEKLQLNIPVTPYFAKRAREGLEQLKKTTSSTHQALIWLWGHLVDEFSPEKPELKDWITLTGDSVKLFLMLPDPLRHRLESYERTQAKLEQAVPIGVNDAEFRLYELIPPAPLNELSQFLLLAHDVLWDINDETPDWLSESAPSAHWFGLLPHAEIGIRFEKKDVRLGWPTPRWATFLDWRLEDRSMTESLAPVRTVLESDKTPKYFRRVLAACLDSALSVSAEIGRRRSAAPSVDVLDQDFRSWYRAGNRIRRIFDPTPTNNTPPSKDSRSALVRAWALHAAPLYASPEMGLPPSFAKGFLAGWMNVSHDIPEQDSLEPMSRKQSEDYRQLRRLWAARCFRNSGLPSDESEVRRFLREIDRQNENHPWHQVFGAEPDVESYEGL